MSNPQIVTIGRAADNALVVNQPSVSQYHAVVTFITDQIVLLEDKNSTFGTNVDGRRILQTVIGPDSQVMLGQVEPLDYRKILALRAARVVPAPQPAPVPPKQDPLDFRKEFKLLANVQETYQEARETIQINNPRQQAKLRAAFALMPIAGLFLGPVGVIAGAMGAGISQILAAEFLNPSQKLIALEKDYKLRYVCPNPACKRPLGNAPYIDLVARKQCPTCKAKWAD